MNADIVLAGARHELGPVLQKAREYIRDSKARNTRSAYQQDWAHFTEWCLARGMESLPATPETVVLYVTDLAERFKASTIQRHVASISVAHQAAGMDSPTHSMLVRTALKGIRRTIGITREKKSPVRVCHLIHISDVLPNNLQGVRDKALFLVGYAGAFRRSELVALDVGDVRFVPEGVRITVRQSKTDQEGAGHTKDINCAANPAHCPVKALKCWMEKAAIESGPLFRPINRHDQVLPQRLTPQSVALIVKRVVTAMRLSPEQFSGHSLRSGFVTDAIKYGIQSQVIRRVTGHRSESTLAEYFREADTFEYNIISRMGL